MLTLITAPDELPVTLAEAKAHLAVVGAADDALLERLIASAVAAFDGPEGKLGRCLISQTWRFDLAAFPVDNLRLPLPPVSAVSEISYTDSAGAAVTLDPSGYFVTGLGSADRCFVAPVSRWPSARSVSVKLIAGFGGDAESVPEDIRNAILSVVGSAYAWRESSVSQSTLSANPEVTDVVDRWRVRGFG